jgi:hypothetical protein
MTKISKKYSYPTLESLEIGDKIEIMSNPDYPKFSNSTAIKTDEFIVVSVIRETGHCFEGIESSIKPQNLLEYAAEMEAALELSNAYDFHYIEAPLRLISNKQLQFTFSRFVDNISSIVDYLDTFYEEYEDEKKAAYDSLCNKYGLDLKS